MVIACEPDVAFAPDHPPLAVQEVALVEDQVKVVKLPDVTEVGLAERVTVGAGVGGGVTDVEASAEISAAESATL